jgi:hypothetical protein
MAQQNRIFISFAVEDAWARDLLVGQACTEDSPFEFIDMSVKEPWDERWKTQCRRKIRGCDGVIAMLTWDTLDAEGALWEMRCTIEERIPIIGVIAESDDPPRIPDVLANNGVDVIDWTWNGIAEFIDSLL